ncbi:uncharacterized protein LOC110857700 [Folsomia candida]|uniref:Exodeoxyribonuclease 7 large subunit n=1 Tax=Folsomia candida TaxID=158441 RepID=A0A226DH43_FOLCA|nr:uncharacterized protein LOC110857700 [Folsomia candida]OXA44489.1 Exodeoxyribonuclease 7 large subunit [Folsomia candida]
MFKVFALVALFATGSIASAISSAVVVKKGVAPFDGTTLGVVQPVGRCGGVGTPLQLRISGCEGYCELQPGSIYNCEEDFMPSMAAPSLILKIEICMSAGFCMIILETELANSSVQPGFIYTAKYSIVPNDILSGQTVEFKAYISASDTMRLEICVSAFVDILFGVGR